MLYTHHNFYLVATICTNYFSLCAVPQLPKLTFFWPAFAAEINRLPAISNFFADPQQCGSTVQSSEKNCQKQKEEKLRARTAAALEMHEELRPYCYYRGVLACSAKLLCALGCMCPDGTSALLHSVPCMHCTAHRASVTISSPPRKNFLKTVACTQYLCYWLQLDLRC